MKNETIRRGLSLLLVFCLLAGVIPCLAVTANAAEAEEPPAEISLLSDGTINSQADLQTAIDALGSGDSAVFSVTGFAVTSPIKIPDDTHITIRGQERGATTLAVNDETAWTGSKCVFEVSNKADLTLQELTVDGREKVRCVYVWGEGNPNLTLERVTLKYGNAYNDVHSGAAICMNGGGTLTVNEGCTFTGNKASTTSPTSGGAIYLYSGVHATFRGSKQHPIYFSNNVAHSGGALYIFDSYVFAENCKFGVENELEQDSGLENHADQRGGAIHCHGTMVIKDSIIQKNTSSQYGGGIYISSNEACKGLVVLDNTTITNNVANAAGGGVFVASEGSLFLRTGSSVSGNQVCTIVSQIEHVDGNVAFSGDTGQIVACDDGLGPVGVSAVSPAFRKLAVFSMKTIPEALYNDLNNRLENIEEYEWEVNRSHEQSAVGNFTYDGGGWELKNRTTDNSGEYTQEQLSSGQYINGNLWLNISKEYIIRYVGGSSSTVVLSKPYVVFDYNIPGMAATVYPSSGLADELVVGGKIATPQKSETGIGRETLKFLGWSTQPSGGTIIPGGTEVEVKAGHQVYYAQWELVPPPPDPTPVVPDDLFTVYFDYNYEGGGVTSALVGTFKIKVELTYYDHSSGEGGSLTTSGTVKQTKTATIPFVAPSPSRPGYDFKGWATSRYATVGSTTPAAPTSTTTYYATWKGRDCTLTWNAKGGSGGGTVTVDYGSIIEPPETPPTRKGHTFAGWYLRCVGDTYEFPLTTGTKVTGDATFYAKWVPNEYTITWDANYTGGGITSIKQYYGEELYDMPAPTREGYGFNGWNTKRDGTGKSSDPGSYGNVQRDETFYAQWSRDVKTYTVEIDWQDQSNNDRVRPDSITVQLMANGIPAKVNNDDVVYTFYASKHSGDIWEHEFHGLPVADAVSNEIVYTVAITSPVSDEYSYGIENKSAGTGYILMTHSLILRDVDAYVVWDDDSNNDGIRPPAIDLQLCVDDTPVAGSEKSVTLSGSGNTWFYRFRNVQKYNTPPGSETAVEIPYNIAVNEPSGYTVEYNNYTAILHHDKDLVSRTTHVEWQDNNDQDGKRPASMAVQLYGDNVPLEGKVVLLSDANNWTYTWDELPKFADGGREVSYSARVTSSLVDYTAKSAGMTIEMTYVPSSTSISAFVTWTDENNADGLRPDFITAELEADGKATGDRQVLSATNGWTMTWSNYPIYKDGKRIEYTFKVYAPSGYEVEYNGVYDTSGLSAVLTHARLKQSLTGNIVWEDRNNQSGGRMSQVAVLLYADGAVIDEDKKVWISADEGWEHTFSDLPIYRDGGEEIKYSMVLISDPGKYVATTSKMTITMQLEPEYVDVPFQIIWDDNNNSDSARPGYVAVTLLVDGKSSQFGQTATAQSDWAVTFAHLDRYGANGQYLYTAQLVLVPEGYTANYTSPGVVVLKRVAETKNVTATVIWQDNDDQYGERPGQVTLTLYADRLDGNGPQNTGRVEKCKAGSGWEFTFENVPAYSGGKNIIYSVVASGNLANYTVSYDGMDVYMRHAGYHQEVTTNYTANLVWHDGHNAKGSRPYNILVTLYANGESVQTYTMTEADLDATGYTWSYTFTKLPTKVDGADVVYTIGITEPSHYTAQTEGNTITLTHVMDIPVLLRWADQRNNDGVRPSALTLNLYGDAAQTDTTLTLTGDSTAETWRGAFQQIPVWSEGLLDHEIVYTWAFAGDSLTDNGYSVDYNGYGTATVGNEALYPIDIARPGDVTDVAATILWNDETDQDGLRPTSRTVRLYADGVDTGKAITLRGGNEDENWRDKFTALPVWKNGQRIQYSIQAEALADYTAAPVPGDSLTLMMSHEPFMDEISATVDWKDETNQGGLTRFPISVALKVDNTVTDNIQTIESSNTSVSFGEHPRFHDHGVPYTYTVQVTDTTMADKPADYDITADILTVTVKRAVYHVSGIIKDATSKKPISGATVMLFGEDNTALETVISGRNGEFHFAVRKGTYTVLSFFIQNGYYSGEIPEFAIESANLEQDILLEQDANRLIVSGQVVLSNGEPASGAQVTFSRHGTTEKEILSADSEGMFAVFLPRQQVYDVRAYYSYIDKSSGDDTPVIYASVLYNCGLISSYDNMTIRVVVPAAGAVRSNVQGRVVNAIGRPVSTILVRCLCTVNNSQHQMVVEAYTNGKGEFTLYGLPEAQCELLLKDQCQR